MNMGKVKLLRIFGDTQILIKRNIDPNRQGSTGGPKIRKEIDTSTPMAWEIETTNIDEIYQNSPHLDALAQNTISNKME